MITRKTIIIAITGMLVSLGAVNIAIAQCNMGEGKMQSGSYSQQGEKGKGPMKLLSIIDDLTPEQRAEITAIATAQQEQKMQSRQQIMTLLTDSQREQMKQHMREHKH